MKKVFKSLLLAIGILLLVMVLKAFVFNTKPEFNSLNSPSASSNVDGSAFLRFSKALQFRTLSPSGVDDSMAIQKFQQLHHWMKINYPVLAQKAIWSVINQGSLLIELPSMNKTLPAALFLGHLDVVPVEDSSNWKYPPFDGTIEKDTLWGRGALDDKNAVIALLESAEAILKTNKIPQRRILLAFGHDEEVGGNLGAAQISKYLKDNNIEIGFVNDEGFGVMEKVIPGLKNDAAIIGVAEKGYATVEISVEIKGGHSAWPKRDNTTSVLTSALKKLDETQFESRIQEPIKGLFESSAPYMDWGYRLLFSNLWITSPLVKWVLNQGDKTAATVRTTHVTTIINAGEKENVVPPKATAIVNFRLLPGDSIKNVIDWVKRTINDDRVKVRLTGNSNESSPVSPSNGLGFDELHNSVNEVFPSAVVVPGLAIVGSDCKHYIQNCDRIYRFLPYKFNSVNLTGIHGKNEHVIRADFENAVRFYTVLFGKL